MQIRRLSKNGLELLREYLAELRQGQKSPPPHHLLTDDAASEPVTPYVAVDTAMLDGTKLRLARTVTEALAPLGRVPGLDRDVGLWSWLALAVFDEICPAKADGTRKPGKDWHYILSHDYQSHYRHLVRSPWLVYSLHGEDGIVGLVGPSRTHGEAAEQLLSRMQVVLNKPLFAALGQLYVEDRSGELRYRRGAGGKGGGSLRRLAKVIRQFDLTYDLQAMRPDDILELLPGEFDKFKTPVSTPQTSPVAEG